METRQYRSLLSDQQTNNNSVQLKKEDVAGESYVVYLPEIDDVILSYHAPKQVSINEVADKNKDKKYFSAESLHYVAKKGDLATVKWLIGHDLADINDQDDMFHRTALHEAAYHGQLAVAKYLVNIGADMELKDYTNQTPLSLALSKNHWEMVGFLLAQGAIINTSVFYEGIVHGELEIVKYYLTHGHKVNEKDQDGKTPLHHAVLAAEDQYFKVFSAKKNLEAIVNDKLYFAHRLEAEAESALQASLTGKYVEVIKYLLAEGACLNNKDNDGKKPSDLVHYSPIKDELSRSSASRHSAGFFSKHFNRLKRQKNSKPAPMAVIEENKINPTARKYN